MFIMFSVRSLAPLVGSLQNIPVKSLLCSTYILIDPQNDLRMKSHHVPMMFPLHPFSNRSTSTSYPSYIHMLSHVLYSDYIPIIHIDLTATTTINSHDLKLHICCIMFPLSPHYCQLRLTPHISYLLKPSNMLILRVNLLIYQRCSAWER